MLLIRDKFSIAERQTTKNHMIFTIKRQARSNCKQHKNGMVKSEELVYTARYIDIQLETITKI